MATILIWMAPETSHILPTIKLARDLQLLNHKVIYLASRSLHDQLSSFGFLCYPFLDGILDEASSELYSVTSSSVEWQSILLSKFANDPAAAYKAISSNIQQAAIAVRADLVLIDGLMNYLHGVSSGDGRPDWQVGYIQTYLPHIFLRRNKAQSQRLLSRIHRTVILCPKEIELPHYRNAAGRYAEGCVHLDRGAIEFKWGWLEPGRRVIYCSLGSQSSVYCQAPQILRAVIEVAKRMPDYQFVVSAGPHYRDLHTGDPLPNCGIFKIVPQTCILERVSAMILQGGLGSIKECIYFGVPMLIVPFVNDQPVNGVRVQRHGLGISMSPEQAISGGIYNALGQLLNDQLIHTGVKKMQAVFREREQENIAANICEEFLESNI